MDEDLQNFCLQSGLVTLSPQYEPDSFWSRIAPTRPRVLPEQYLFTVLLWGDEVRAHAGLRQGKVVGYCVGTIRPHPDFQQILWYEPNRPTQ